MDKRQVARGACRAGATVIAAVGLLVAGWTSAAADAVTHQALQDILEVLPENSWTTVNTNTFQSVWAPANKRGTFGTPKSIIEAWGSMAYDSHRGDLVIFGGGHANYTGNDAYRFRTSTLTWERMSLPSQIRSTGGSRYETVDGPLNSPISSHLYDNTEYLPISDRVVSFGGAAYNTGGRYLIETSPGSSAYRTTGPYFLDPSRADANKVGGLDGSGIVSTDLGSMMWENRDNLSAIPGGYHEGSTAYATIGGKDVIYFTSPYVPGLYEYTVNDPADPSRDSYRKVGNFLTTISGSGSATYDPEHRLYVRIDGTGLTYWDVGDPAVVSTIREIDARLADGSPVFTAGGGAGIDYDPERERYLIWTGTDQVYAMSVPAVLTSPWPVVPLDPTGNPGRPSRNNISGGAFTGVLGKWDYAPGYDVFFGLMDPFRGDVWVYKPDDWQPSFLTLASVPQPPAMLLFAFAVGALATGRRVVRAPGAGATGSQRR